MVDKVRDLLDMQDKKGIPIQSRKNCITVLGLDPALCGRIKFNTLSCRKNVCGALPWNDEKKRREWTNIDDEYLLYYMETFYSSVLIHTKTALDRTAKADIIKTRKAPPQTAGYPVTC